MRRQILNCTILVTMAVTTACASLQTPITDFATDYNRVIADTRNEMILLNILRAQHREPIYYSSISEVSGAISVSGSIGLTGTRTNDSDPAEFIVNTRTPSLSLTTSSAPTFKVVPLNTNDFVRGALRPVSPATVRLLLDQGWEAGFLAPLLIDSIECGNRPDLRSRNEAERSQISAEDSSPAGEIGESVFHSIYEQLENHPRIENDPSNTGPIGSYEFFSRIAIIADNSQAPGINVALNGNDYVDFLVAQRSNRFVASIPQRRKREGRANTDQVPAQAESAPGTMTFNIRPRASLGIGIKLPNHIVIDGYRVPRSIYCPPVASGRQLIRTENEDEYSNFVMRSPQGIISFLGEFLRAEMAGQAYTNDFRQLNLATGRGSASVAANYRGTRYYVSQHSGGSDLSSERDRSMQTFELINQLLALQTSTEDLNRVSSTVRVR